MKEKLNYECINGHKWKSKEWPVSTQYEKDNRELEVIPAKYLLGFIPISPPKLIKKQMTATRCPECGTDICMCQTEDGKQGAMHQDFVENKKEPKRK